MTDGNWRIPSIVEIECCVTLLCVLSVSDRLSQSQKSRHRATMKSVVCLLAVILVVQFGEVQPKHHQSVPTYFARKNKHGEFIDATDPSTWIKINAFHSRSSKVTVNPILQVQPSIVKDGGYVNVLWKGIEDPTANDIIALYCPGSAKDNEYLDYFPVTVSPTYKQGNGSHSVQLTNLRTNCEFSYFKQISKDKQELVATSNVVMFEGGPEAPLQVHLALTGDPTQMRVMWVSGTDETPIVLYSTDKNFESVGKGESKTYKASDLCFINGKFIDPGFIHDVLLTNLKPSTVYYYSCGVNEHMSEVRSFKTAPPVGSEASFKFIAYGDMGLSGEAQTIAKYSLQDVQNGYEFVFHVGDISYARGYAYIWDQWHSLIQPYSSIVPYMVGIGNHEQDHMDVSTKDLSGVTGNGFHPWWGDYGDDSNGECGVPMFYRFHMPDNGNYLWWYSYDYGMVHFIMMSTEHDMAKGSRQYTWLENDLKNVDRSKTPWIVLGGHRPMYTSEVEKPDFFVALGIQVMLEDLFYQYKVDLALWGHYHSYERTCAVYKNECTEGGTVHIVIGTAGASADPGQYIPPNWSLVQRHIDPYGYGRIAVANRSALHWEYFVNSEEKVVDDVWFIK